MLREMMSSIDITNVAQSADITNAVQNGQIATTYCVEKSKQAVDSLLCAEFNIL